MALITAIAIVPKTSHVKVLCGFGFSASAIGGSTLLDNTFLALCGDGNKDLGPSIYWSFHPPSPQK